MTSKNPLELLDYVFCHIIHRHCKLVILYPDLACACPVLTVGDLGTRLAH